MQKRPISKVFDKTYTEDEIKEHISKEVDNLKFEEHCKQVAKNLNIDVVVVKELLMDNSYTVLSLVQKSILKNKVVKINITGFFSFVTVLIKFKMSHLRKITKGRTY